MDKIIISLFAAVLLALAPAAVAQSLQTYFNFTTYGTQGGGASLADLTGHTTATLNTEAHTTLTSSGLTISSGGISLNTGATIGSAAMSGFTGAFSIQQRSITIRFCSGPITVTLIYTSAMVSPSAP